MSVDIVDGTHQEPWLMSGLQDPELTPQGPTVPKHGVYMASLLRIVTMV